MGPWFHINDYAKIDSFQLYSPKMTVSCAVPSHDVIGHYVFDYIGRIGR